MATLGTLSGTGTLRAGGQEATVQYRLSVVHQRHSLSGHGSLDGDMRAIHRAFDATDCVLVLKDGGEVKIVINNLAVGQSASFLTSGPIPGGWENMI